MVQLVAAHLGTPGELGSGGGVSVSRVSSSLTVKAAALVVMLAAGDHVKGLRLVALGDPRRFVVAVANTYCAGVRVPPRRVWVVLNLLELRTQVKGRGRRDN